MRMSCWTVAGSEAGGGKGDGGGGSGIWGQRFAGLPVEELSFEYVIWIRGNVRVTDAKGDGWEQADGRAGCEGCG